MKPGRNTRSKNELENKDLLEVGSGNGRFTEILLDYKSNLITFDSSNAIFQNYKHNISKINTLHIHQSFNETLCR